jgi:hypothetical protein
MCYSRKCETRKKMSSFEKKKSEWKQRVFFFETKGFRKSNMKKHSKHIQWFSIAEGKEKG